MSECGDLIDLKQLAQFLNAKADMDKEYSKSLSKLSNGKLFSSTSPLLKTLKKGYQKLSSLYSISSSSLYSLRSSLVELIQLKKLARRSESKLSFPKMFRRSANSIEMYSLDTDTDPVMNIVTALSEIEYNLHWGSIQAVKDRSLRSRTQSLSFLSLNKSLCELPEPSEDEISNIVSKFLNTCWEGDQVADEDLKKVTKIARSSQGRQSWVVFLNEKRGRGSFIIPGASFNTLKNVQISILDAMIEDNDMAYLKQIIILSQTFYTFIENQKCFLQEFIKHHDIWSIPDLWDEMILDSANEEFTSYLNHCLGDNTPVDEELPKILRTIFISQIIAFLHLMACFDISEERIKQVIGKFNQEYGIPKDVSPVALW